MYTVLESKPSQINHLGVELRGLCGVTLPARSLESAHLISEKILQRYVFERLSESASTRRNLPPRRLDSKASEFRVLIPEYDLTSPKHRADFRLIFRDKSAQNIEVEWTTSRFKHGAEVVREHYADGKGFLVVLDDDRNLAPDYVQSIEAVRIPPREFSWWFSKRARTLLDSTIAARTESYSVRPPKYWVIYLGKQGGADSDYLQRGRPNGIWAFRYGRGENLANIISILKGDVVIFTTKWKVPGSRRIYAGGSWSCSHIDIFEVTHGYWCDFTDRTFEKPNWNGKAEDKEYMHYFTFSNAANKELLFKTENDISVRGSDFHTSDLADVGVCDAFRKSNTQAGAPVEMSEESFQTLRQRLDTA